MELDDTLRAFRAAGLVLPIGVEERTTWARSFNASPPMSRFGAHLDLSDDRLVVVTLGPIEEHHRGGLGTQAINGAVLAGLFDCALGAAGTAHFWGRRAGTCELSLKFMHAVKGPDVTAYAIATKASPNLAFVESRLYDGDKRCAVATGIVAAKSSRTT